MTVLSGQWTVDSGQYLAEKLKCFDYTYNLQLPAICQLLTVNC